MLSRRDADRRLEGDTMTDSPALRLGIRAGSPGYKAVSATIRALTTAENLPGARRASALSRAAVCGGTHGRRRGARLPSLTDPATSIHSTCRRLTVSSKPKGSRILSNVLIVGFPTPRSKSIRTRGLNHLVRTAHCAVARVAALLLLRDRVAGVAQEMAPRRSPLS